MSWCFAIVNNKLAEIFFDKTSKGKAKIRGFCYVKKNEYKNKKERKWIKEDTAKVQLMWRKGKYTSKLKDFKLS